jgi:hypothetical protein
MLLLRPSAAVLLLQRNARRERRLMERAKRLNASMETLLVGVTASQAHTACTCACQRACAHMLDAVRSGIGSAQGSTTVSMRNACAQLGQCALHASGGLKQQGQLRLGSGRAKLRIPRQRCALGSSGP